MTSLKSHFRFLTPGSAVRMAKNQARVSVRGEHRLRNTQLALTMTCNHTCGMCSSLVMTDKERTELTLEQWKATVDQLYDLGCTHFDVTGGEPTLKGVEWLCDLIAYITRNGDCVVSMATNGVRIAKDPERWLGPLKAAGLNSLLVDIQSGDHDAMVNHPGNRAAIESFIPLARDNGLNVCINTCLGNYNLDDFEELLEWAHERDLHVLTNLAAPVGELANKDVRVTELRERYYELTAKYPLMRSDTTYNHFGWDRCPGGREKLYVTAYGDVMQCTFVQISFGNVLETPVREIYERFKRHPMIKQQSICKHTFWDEFRTNWVDPLEGRTDLPLPIEQHPFYERYENDDRPAAPAPTIRPHKRPGSPGSLSSMTAAHYREHLGWLFRHLIRVKGRQLARHAGQRKTGLDVGAGCGQYAEYLVDEGYQVTPLDPNQEMIGASRLQNAMVARGESIPCEDDAFDFSYAINVLHHVPDPVAVLREMCRVSGRVIVSEINVGNPVARAFIRRRLPFDDVDEHFHAPGFRDLFWRVPEIKRVHYFQTSLLGVPSVYLWAVCDT